MTEHYYLSEFNTTSIRPKRFWVVLGLFIAIICIYAILLIRSVAGDRLIQQFNFGFIQIYALFFVFLYPLVGAYGYCSMKKYGWNIMTHYCFTSVSVVLLILIFGNVAFVGHSGNILYSKLLIICSILVFGIAGLYQLFTKAYLKAFGLDTMHILQCILISIIFGILTFGISILF